jgi:hypothetical protein
MGGGRDLSDDDIPSGGERRPAVEEEEGPAPREQPLHQLEVESPVEPQESELGSELRDSLNKVKEPTVTALEEGHDGAVTALPSEFTNERD